MDLNTYVNEYLAAVELEQAVINAERARIAAERIVPRPSLLRRLVDQMTAAGATTARRAPRERAECAPHTA
ncbi:hypothetical protein [Microbacterium sp. ZW T5_56]|uniref:hypothetical protein n=1 Tax=Microbacterium sp. ZW T5_56 TaxID=3378081 RepID=UPI0038541950